MKNIVRIKQFYIAFISLFKELNNEELQFVKHVFNNIEYELFDRLSNYDKRHCIKVAKSVKEMCIKKKFSKKDQMNLIKAALVHDIGKIKCKFNIIDRVMFVLLNKLYKKDVILSKWNKARIYYNHAEIGYNILKSKAIFNDDILFLVRNHHNKDIKDYRLKILEISDDKN